MRRNGFLQRIVLGLGSGLMLLAGGCGKAPPAAPGQTHYTLHGEVLTVDPARRVLAVRHEAIAGLMPAMAMEFAVSAGDVAVLHPGDRIRAQLTLDPAGGMPRLTEVWPDDRAAEAAIDQGARALREDTHDRGDGAYREVGEQMPEFILYNQDGKVVQISQFRGKQIMLNFIYTRCPVATMCPASTAKMMATQRLAREAGINDVEFVSITLDPAYDTPGVLKAYAQARNIDTGNFSFLTGPEAAVRDILTQFGVADDFQGELTKHTLATLLIDARGRIIWRADGSIWEPGDFVKRMHRS